MINKLRPAKAAVAAMLLIALLSTPVYADTTYFADDFEGYPADIGYYPDSFTMVSDYGSYEADVRTQNSSNMFYVSSDRLAGDLALCENVAFYTIAPEETQLTLTFTFMKEPGDDEIMLGFGVTNSVIVCGIMADGSVEDVINSVQVAPPGTVVPGTYYKIKVVHNIMSDTADIFIDDVLFVDDMSTTYAFPSGPFFYFGSEDLNSDNALIASAYIDNIVVTGLYTAPAVNPRTGDNANYTIVYIIAGLMLLMICAFAVIKLKRQHN